MTNERAKKMKDAKKKLLEAYEALTECCQEEWIEFNGLPDEVCETPKGWRTHENAQILEEILPDIDEVIVSINGVEGAI